MFQTRESSRVSLSGPRGRRSPSSLVVAAIAALTVVGSTPAIVAEVDPLRETRLTASDGSADAHFGWTVRLNGGTLAVSAPFDVAAEDGPGAIYIYRQEGGDWVEQQKLVPSGARTDALFGYDLALDGDWLAAGAADDASVFVFRRNGTAWTQHQRIPTPDAAAFYFATAVALDGDTLVVGAPRAESDGMELVGRAYVYRYDGSTFTLEQVLESSEPTPFAEFGFDVGVQGDEAFVSAPSVDSGRGAIYVFRRTGGVWAESQKLSPSAQNRTVFGSVLSVRGDLLAASARTLDPGLASTWVYRRTGEVWTEEQKLNISENAEGFGFSIAIDGETILIGAPFDDVAGDASGSAFFFRHDGREWSEDSKLTPGDGGPQDQFGGSVSIEGSTVAVGATGADDNGPDSGAAYVYDSANTPPRADAGDDEDAECTSHDGAVVRLDGSASTDPDSTPGTNDDIVRFEWFEDFQLPGERFLGEGEVLDDVSLSLGHHVVTLRVTDSAGESSTDDVIKQVVDTVPPDFSVGVAPETLWPPNGRWVEIATSATAWDACGETEVALTSVEVYDNGVRTEAPSDVRAIDAGGSELTLKLRAKRTGRAAGRVYRIKYAAKDPSGNRSSDEAQVTVPHDQGSRGHGPKRTEKKR